MMGQKIQNIFPTIPKDGSQNFQKSGLPAAFPVKIEKNKQKERSFLLKNVGFEYIFKLLHL